MWSNRWHSQQQSIVEKIKNVWFNILVALSLDGLEQFESFTFNEKIFCISVRIQPFLPLFVCERLPGHWRSGSRPRQAMKDKAKRMGNHLRPKSMDPCWAVLWI